MSNNYFRITLHKEHKNYYCDVLAIQAAEMNGSGSTITAVQFHQMIERNIKESNTEGIQAIIHEDTGFIFIDVKAEDGKYYTGLCLQQIELVELKTESEYRAEHLIN